MTLVTLYWNHICVLHRQEKIFLDHLTDRLQREGIALQIRFFGLGYPQHLSEYLAEPEAVLPDLMVSSDLEVFEDRRIFDKFRSELHEVSDWVSLRGGQALEAVRRDKTLLPFLAIPLVYYKSRDDARENIPIYQMHRLAFGGINNSAGKTLVKAVWSRYGKSAAKELLAHSDIYDMPIGAFRQVCTDRREIAIVPSLYALRADEQTSFLRIPKEGPLLIPSYFCARKTLPSETAKKIARTLLCSELSDFYARNGDLIVFPSSACERGPQEGPYFVPSRDWLDRISPEEFYELYCEALPSAKRPF